MKRLRVGVVGVGYLGKLHARKYSEIKEAALVGVADVDGKNAHEVASLYGVGAYASHMDLIGKVDAVSVVTPTESHCDVALDFLSRGVDVLVEKPIAMNGEEAGRLIKEAERMKRVLQVGHLERFNPAVIAMKGRVKDPVFIESRRLSPFPNRSIDIDVILDLMIHDIDIILNLVASDVEAVDAVGFPVLTGKTDMASARIRFKNGCVAEVTASRVSDERMRRLKLFQEGSFLTVDFANQLISETRARRGEGASGSLVTEEIPIEKKEPLLEELRSFVDSSLTRKPPLVSGSDGKRALEVAQRVQDSVRRKGSQALKA